jgi:arsenate reductase
MFTTLTGFLHASPDDLLETLQPTLLGAICEFDQIPDERKALLAEVSNSLRARKRCETAKLTFICTHNSRRSHITHLWAQTAATYFGIPDLETYSGGTEATACNIRTIDAIRRAGFSVVNPTPGEPNPRYLIQYSKKHAPLTAFSKVYDAEGNPGKGFIAIMTCSHADKNCPIVRGAEKRFPIPYLDPKASDGSQYEAHTYDARSRQIAREMLYLMSIAK